MIKSNNAMLDAIITNNIVVFFFGFSFSPFITDSSLSSELI